MHINHKETVVILELNENCWTATYPNDEISNSLFPLGMMPLPYNKDASIELVAEELYRMQTNLQIFHNETQHHGSEIGGVIHLLSPYPCNEYILESPWMVECYNGTYMQRIASGVFANRERALNAAHYCIEPMLGGYSFVKISSTPDFLVTHHSPIDL